ncbi:dimethyl sulfoxide reductase anchor subunit family protein [Oleidesulfovibrio sp.]|uniref:dimethyl sulfoxide reductase anchor subunit family protein n=1 Tax=Oleidesulfovibrio sp. TaxID=2909707 RepID=UPI003A839BD6
MQSMELPLVVFTVLSQASAGLALMGTVAACGNSDYAPGKREWLVISGLMILGIFGSLFHLGHPFKAYLALSHLDKAWLSREVLAAGFFVPVALAAAFTADRNEGKGASPVLGIMAVVLGIVTVLASGMTYAPPALPAVNNALPAVFFMISAVVLGSGFASWFAGKDLQPMLARVFTCALVVGLVITLVAPCVWLSGGAVMRATAFAWLASPLYWFHVIAGFAVPLFVIWRSRSIPVWLPVLILVAELAGRAAFFSDTLHAASNMGMPY